MKIEYKYKCFEFYNYLNIALGIWINKRKIKNNKIKRIRTFSSFYLGYLLVIFMLIPIIVFIDSLNTLDIVANILMVIFWLLLLINGLFLIIVIKVLLMCNLASEGEYIITNKKIWHKSLDYEIEKSWETIDFMVILKKVILLYSKEKVIFIIKNEKDNQKELLKVIKESNISVNVVDLQSLEETSKLQSFFNNYGYVLIILGILINLLMLWDNYNLAILQKEFKYLNINDYKIDSNLYAHGKYRVVESIIKDNYIQFKNNQDLYNEYSAYSTFYLLNIDFLKKGKENVVNLYNDLEMRKEKADRALGEMQRLTNENLAMFQVTIDDLGIFYENVYESYITKLANFSNQKTFEEEEKINNKKMEYLESMLYILVKDDACWYVENDNFYICNDDDLKSYSEYYELLKTQENKVVV